MREIKFRAWDKLNNEMLDNEITIVLLTERRPEDLDEDIEFMQFTGLHDKNGVPVFEGDIVEMIGDYGLPFRQEVKYAKGYYIPLVKVEYRYNAIAEYNPSSFEVVGNVFESPELLEG